MGTRLIFEDLTKPYKNKWNRPSGSNRGRQAQSTDYKGSVLLVDAALGL